MGTQGALGQVLGGVDTAAYVSEVPGRILRHTYQRYQGRYWGIRIREGEGRALRHIIVGSGADIGWVLGWALGYIRMDSGVDTWVGAGHWAH